MEENTNFSTGNEAAGSTGNEAAQRPAYSATAQTAPVQPKKKSSAGKIAALILAFVAVAGAAFTAGALLPKKDAFPAVPVVATGSGSQQGETDADNTEKKTDSSDYTPIENHGFPLPGGRYTIGEDLPAGKYLFIYKTNLSDDDYWSNDYLWITYAGSEGTNETWGGDTYDDRVGDVNYEEANAGKSFYFNLHNGDTIRVDSGHGEWTY